MAHDPHDGAHHDTDHRTHGDADHGARHGAHRGETAPLRPAARRGSLLDDVAPDWALALRPVAEVVDRLDDELLAGAAPGDVLPAREDVMRAFREPLADVKVLVVGQDPYPTPGHAMGLSFSVQPHVRPLPRSLANIVTELHDDLGLPAPATGDLSPWSRQGVMLCNRVLTVAAGDAGSHRRRGWEQVTDRAIQALVERGGPLVAVLWGRDAATLRPALGDVPVVESAHPSPLSARRGFFGSHPFSTVNDLLVAQGASPVDWSLPASDDALF